MVVAAIFAVQMLNPILGGINCLGANVWNMAIVDVFGYFVYRAISGSSRSVAAFAAGVVTYVASTRPDIMGVKKA